MKKPVADPRGRMDLDPGHRARDGSDQRAAQRHAGPVQGVREPVREQRVHARPGREDLDETDAARRRIAAAGRGDVAPDSRPALRVGRPSPSMPQA